MSVDNDWRRSSFCSGGQCVEVAWQRSSFCADTTCVEVAWRTASLNNGTCVEVGVSACVGESNCVEVGCDGDHILIRDSKNPAQQPLAFNRAEWETFVAGIKAGEFRDL